MYTRRWRFRSSTCHYILCPSQAQHPIRSSLCLSNYKKAASLHRKNLSPVHNVLAAEMFSTGYIGKIPKFCGGNFVKRSSVSARFYCSKKDTSATEVRLENGNVKPETSNRTAHASLAEKDRKEWAANVQFLLDRQKRESPFLTRRERFKFDFLRRVIPWEKISLSWDTFPYYINKETKNLLVECVASHLNHKHFTSSFGARLNASSGRILLRGISGTELYRERMVKALAHDLQVPLLVLNDIVHTSYGFDQVCGLDAQECHEDIESQSECSSYSDVEEASNDEDCDDEKSDDSEEENNDEKTAFAVLNVLVPCVDEYAKKVSGELGCTIIPGTSVYKATNSAHKSERAFRKGDLIKYVGSTVNSQVTNRILMGKIETLDGPANSFTVFSSRSLVTGQRGEVYEVNGDQVAVILDSAMNRDEKDKKIAEHDNKPSICWIDIQEIEYDNDIEAQDWYIAIEALSEVLSSMEPIIVYFADSSLRLSRAVPKSSREEFMKKLEEMFNQSSSCSRSVVWICGKNNVVSCPKQGRKLVVLSKPGRLGTLPSALRQLIQSLKENKAHQKVDMSKVFTNVFSADPPKEEAELREFHKLLEEDKIHITSRTNIVQLHKVLEKNELSCLELSLVKTDGMVFTKQKARQVVGWARNHYLSSCSFPSIIGDKLTIPRESFEIVISRVEGKDVSTNLLDNLKDIAKDDYEKSFVSAVVPSSEIGVKFEDIGALDNVKKILDELVTLPMRRPELFSHGNLLRPCKGILLFGPPGTGKTLLAKALATEAGVNFINITGSILTSKWFGDAEKLTKALFSFASKLSPVIIFVDEVDSLLGSRGGSSEHEATRRMRNEFMAAWDGLRSKDSQRIIVLGATNRPFDLDDAVIRRLPRRIYVDLPNAESRMKILRIFLKQETLDLGFKYEEVANVTEGYSGSDLKNLCIAAAYRPVQELLEEEKRGGREFGNHVKLRPLNSQDFIQAKLKVGASVAYDATSMNELRKWNERFGEGGSRTQPPFGFDSQVK